MFRKLFILASLFTFLSTPSFSQETLAKIPVEADKDFISGLYSQAASGYEKFLKSNPKDYYASRQAALSYLKLNDQSKAIDHWTNVMESSQANDKDRLEYAKCLLANYRTEDAKRVFTSLANSSDASVAAWGKAFFNPAAFYADSALCKVYEVNGVSTHKISEYSPVYYLSHLLFIKEADKKPGKNGRPSVQCSAERVDSASFNKILAFNKQIQNKYVNGPLCFTPDDSTMYFTRSASAKLSKKYAKVKDQPLKRQIFYTAMNMYGLAHDEIHPFVYNSFDYDCMHPTISKNGKRLYFASNMPGGLGGFDIYVCEWKDGSWAAPKNLGPQINTTGNEQYPFISSEDILYFASDSRPGLGGMDIFYAEPTNNEKLFIEAENLGTPVNSQFDDFGVFILKDGKRGYFSSNRKNGLNDNDVYYMVNNKPKSFPAKIQFVDSITGGGVTSSFTISLITGRDMQTLDSGKFYSTRLKPGKQMNVEVASERYFPKTFVKQIEVTDTIVTIGLRPRSRKCIEGKIIDKENNLALSGVKVAIYDEEGNKYLDYITDSTGKYSVCNLPLDKPLYIGSQKKPDYFTNTEKFVITKGNDLVKDFYAVKIVVGKAIKIDNIYFDKGKFNVRQDAALELDKLVKLMKDNPEIIIELSSHTDCNGAAAANMALSDKRAKSSAAYIVSKGINKNRIKGKGYGESKLVNDCQCEGKKVSTCTEEQHAQNRRAEIKVIGFVPEATPAKSKTTTKPVKKKK